MRDDAVSHIEMRSRLDSSRRTVLLSVPLVMFSTPHRRNNESVDAQPAIFKLDGHAVRRSIRLGKSIFIT